MFEMFYERFFVFCVVSQLHPDQDRKAHLLKKDYNSRRGVYVLEDLDNRFSPH